MKWLGVLRFKNKTRDHAKALMFAVAVGSRALVENPILKFGFFGDSSYLCSRNNNKNKG